VRQKRPKRSSRGVILLLGFFALILGGPVLLSAIFRMLRGSKTPNKRRIPRAKPQAIAKFDFAGEAQGDLPFKKGDLITIRRPVGQGWLEGELSNGQVGIVPESYVEPYNAPHARPNNVPPPPSMEDYPPF